MKPRRFIGRRWTCCSKCWRNPRKQRSFILICPNAFELRSTIRSRCMRIAFQPVEQALMQTF